MLRKSIEAGSRKERKVIPRFLDRVTESEVGPLAGKRHQREAEQQRNSVSRLWKLWGI